MILTLFHYFERDIDDVFPTEKIDFYARLAVVAIDIFYHALEPDERARTPQLFGFGAEYQCHDIAHDDSHANAVRGADEPARERSDKADLSRHFY